MSNPHNKARKNPTKKPALPDTQRWHDEGTLPNGWKVGKLGACWYILDEDGWAISEGYHEISDDGRVGKLGASSHIITLRGTPAKA